jgi:hypothetical protein
LPVTDDVHGVIAELLRRYDVNEYAASVQVYALKMSPEATAATEDGPHQRDNPEAP